MEPQRREQQELRLVGHQPLEEADLGRGGVVEKKDGLPTDNREKKGKGSGRKQMGGGGGDRESGDSEWRRGDLSVRDRGSRFHVMRIKL